MKKPPTVEYIHVKPPPPPRNPTGYDAPPTMWGPTMLVAGLVTAAIVWIFTS